MIQKTDRLLKTVIKFILFGNLKKTIVVNNSISHQHINYHMTSVFPDKQTKDAILSSINNCEY